TLSTIFDASKYIFPQPSLDIGLGCGLKFSQPDSVLLKLKGDKVRTTTSSFVSAAINASEFAEAIAEK
ncbi:45939_t:CDS:1, partial [Gigaspora margarita]